MDIKEIINQSIKTKQEVLNNNSIIEEIKNIVDVMVACFKNNNKVLWCGNGGSAADAQHLAAEFSGRFYYDRPALNSEALHCNTSFLTAIGNDYSYDIIFSRMIEAVGKKGDVLVGISTSGNSKNVVLALKEAKQRGLTTISFTGEGGGEMKNYSDYIISVPSKDTPRVQECQIMIGHIICQGVEEEMFPKK
ncbi:MAG: D-sedoheptulose 7-phosphate isomerase [Bacteroidales bacterium]|jgi:D-sedoheptulose 7-phosphate isomerase|nr:D-sedoheptulose 7-phosphate isomerase [Bacteroidales bacterium]